MKKNLVTAIAFGLVTSGLMFTVARADNQQTSPNYKEFGFHSPQEMNNYFTVSTVEVHQVQTELTPELAAQLSDLFQIYIPVTINPPANPQAPVSAPSVAGQTPTSPIFIPGTSPAQIPGTVPGSIPSIPKPNVPQIPGTQQPSTPGLPSSPIGGTKPGQITIPGTGGIVIDPSGITAWITVGEKIWQIISANRPVANVSSQRVAVLPVDQQNWAQMDSWKGPALSTYTLTAKNLFGTQVFSETYTVAFNYGGSYNGKGSYLANVTIIPQKIVVVWGYTLDSSVEVGQTINVGTKDNPVPGLSMDLKYGIGNIFKRMDGHDAFFVKGTGDVVHLSPGN